LFEIVKMKKLHKGQRGFTMLELLIALAITALITTSITMAISQTFTGTTRSSNHMVAVRQVQETGYWVSYYAFSAQNMTITGDSGFPLILCWFDFGPPCKRQKIVFSLNNTGLKGLRGSYYVDSGSGYVLDSVKTGNLPVFEFINPDKTKTNCQVSGGSDFSLPDAGDAFKITGGAIPDNGIITPDTGLSVTPTGSATVTHVVPPTGTPYWEWTTTTTGDNITVTATSSNRKGSWTSATRAATAAITADSDKDATLSNARGLILTVTATVGSGQQQESETRTYIVVPKPAS
jgi:prepilin-type N-terminal cleavage/methylation domain-containing protein